MARLILVIFGFFIMISCQKNKPSSADKNAEVETNKKVLNLSDEIRIEYSGKEEFDNFTTYWGMVVYKNNKKIYENKETEYEIKDNYPRIRKLGQKHEILSYINDRPNIGKVELLLIKGNKLEKRELIPAFKGKPRDVDMDGVPEIMGVMEHFEEFGANYGFVGYNPILVYEFSEDGIKLDSIETQQVNLNIYGTFHGYEYNEGISYKKEEILTNVEKYLE